MEGNRRAILKAMKQLVAMIRSRVGCVQNCMERTDFWQLSSPTGLSLGHQSLVHRTMNDFFQQYVGGSVKAETIVIFALRSA